MAAVSLQLNMPIQSASVINENEQLSANQTTLHSDGLMQAAQQVDALCSALQAAAGKLEQYTEELFLSHKDQIARLSVEIASKILAKDRADRNYEIEKIVSQALQTVPASRQMTVRLNPDDLKTIRRMSEADEFTMPEGVHFVPDPGVSPAECVIETDHGVVEYLIEEHLKQIADALLQTKDEIK